MFDLGQNTVKMQRHSYAVELSLLDKIEIVKKEIIEALQTHPKIGFLRRLNNGVMVEGNRRITFQISYGKQLVDGERQYMVQTIRSCLLLQ